MEEREKLLDKIDAFLEEIGGYTDYEGRVDAVAEEFGMSRDEAENYVWMWASEVPGDTRYEEIESKSVMDSNGFYTDYTWYKDIIGNRHVFVFGDRDLYKPEDENFDWEIEGNDERAQEEAEEWFNSYNGFDEDEDDYNEDDMMDESLRSTMTWCNISHPLKEAADREIDRKGSKSLIKYGVRDDGGNYAVLNDGYLVRKFWAENDDEAKEIFRRGPSRMPELTQDPMAAGQWYESLKESKEPNEDKWYDGLTKGQKESAMKIALWHKIVAKETSWDKLSAEDKKLVKQAYQKVEKLIKKHIKNESLNEALSGDLYDYDQAVEYIASHGLPTEPDSDLGEYVYELLSEYSEPCYTRETLDQIIELAEEVDNEDEEEYEESLKEEASDDWYSQVHAPKSEVIYWLQDHEQAYEDILNHFDVSSLDYIGLDQIEEWISEHDQLAQDFENYFSEKSK